jgi:hypothetical protein
MLYDRSNRYSQSAKLMVSTIIPKLRNNLNAHLASNQAS